MMNLKNKIYNLLVWSQKYTKTDMVYIAKGGFWLTLKQIIVAISLFLLAIIFANFLPKETFGTYKYILSASEILIIFSLNGIYTAIIQSTARGYEGSFIENLKIRIKWGLLGTIISLIIALYYFTSGNTTLSIGFLIISLFIPFFESFQNYDALLIGRKNFRDSSLLFMILQIIVIGLMIGALFLTKNLFIILLVHFLSFSFIGGLFFILIYKKHHPNKNTDPELIKYGKHLSLLNAFSLASNYIDKILVYNFLGPTELAIYIFAITPPNQIWAFLNNMQTLALPKYSEKDGNESRIGMSKKLIIFGAIIAAISIIYIFAAPPIYRLIFPQYSEAIGYTQLYSLFLITAIIIIPFTFIKSQKNIKALYRFNTITPILNTIILIIMIQFGLTALIIGKIINGFINLFYLLKISQKNN